MQPPPPPQEPLGVSASRSERLTSAHVQTAGPLGCVSPLSKRGELFGAKKAFVFQFPE